MCGCKKKKNPASPPIPQFSASFEGGGDEFVEIVANKSILAIVNGERFAMRSGKPMMLQREAFSALQSAGAPVWTTEV